MPRKATGKVTEDKVWVKQKNGTWYCYARKRTWRDGKTVVLEKRLIGKADERGGELRPTRARRRPGADQAAIEDARPAVAPAVAQTSMCDLLEFVGSRSGIDCDLRSVTDGPTADRLASLARYLATNDRAEIFGIEEWQLTHPVPCKSAITPDDCARLLREVGADESLVEGFFRARIAREEDPCRLVAFDTTRTFPETRTPEPCDVPFADHTDSRTRGLLVLFSMTSRRPLAYARRPDHVPETLSWEQALGRLGALGAQDVTLVPGHISEADLAAILRAGEHVLAEASVEWGWVRTQLETHLLDLHESAGVLVCDTLTRCISVPVTLDLDRLGASRARADEDRGDASAGASRTERQVCLHLYFDPALKDEQDRAFFHELEDVASLVRAGIPLDDGAGKVRDDYLDVRGRGRRATLRWREDAVSEACRLNGVFALVTDSLEDAGQALEAYRERERIADCITRTDERHRRNTEEPVFSPRDEASHDGCRFVQFVAMCYAEYLRERVRQMTGSLGRREGDPDHDLQEGPDVELELKRWLDGRAPQRILAWFDARQVAGIPHDVTNMRWSASAVERDALFLGLLGIAEGNG